MEFNYIPLLINLILLFSQKYLISIKLLKIFNLEYINTF
jgi:hypothetical protein